MTQIPIRRALISVYDKTGLEELASGLHAAGVEIVSTGNSAARIAAAGVPVTPVEELTGFPECLDGRVKTLHPRVHAGLLADIGNSQHVAQLVGLRIESFQLLVSNLYPFEATVASGASPEQCVEQIDIGGPAMVRAAAKNHGSVAVVTDPSRYADVLAALAEGGFTLDQRRLLAAAAFAHTAAYDVAVASWFASAYAPDETAREAGWPEVAGALWRRADVLRYGENPHQRAALYTRPGAPAGIATAELLHGKAMSYNNYVDADAARRAAYDFAEPCVAIIKHSNPCGIAIGADLAEAHAKAHACDPVSAFGGVIAANGPVTAALARQIKDVFTEVVIAPEFGAEALDILSASKNVRLLAARGPRGLGGLRPEPAGPGGDRPPEVELRLVTGGMLLQTADRVDEPGDDPANWQLKAGEPVEPRGARGSGVRVEGMPFGQIQRHLAGRRRRLGRGRDGPGQPGGFGPAGGAAGRRPGRGLGGGQRRLLPVPRRFRDPGPGRGARRRRTRRLDPRPPGRRGRRGRGHPAVLHRRTPLLPLRGRAVTAQVLDGKAVAAQIRAELTLRVEALAEQGIVPGLGTVLVGDDPGSRAYVNGKHRDCAQVGIASIRRDLPADATQAQVEAVVAELNADPACTGYIVQLPLPAGLDAHAVLTKMDPAKDADGLHPANLGKLVLGEHGPLPCTPRGIVELLRRYGVAVAGADVTVIGRGITVGRALGLLLTRRTENATVTQCHTGTKDVAAHTRTADIVVVAAGRPGLLTADMVKPGAAVVDVGITRTDAEKAWSATSPPRSPRWPAGWPRCRAESAR